VRCEHDRKRRDHAEDENLAKCPTSHADSPDSKAGLLEPTTPRAPDRAGAARSPVSRRGTSP
jgi:hypothetical protein